jgi:RNA polymerase sigma factor (sigma-70 family)
LPTATDTDLNLWTQARRGDVDAFGRLFERHARAIYNFCFRRTADWSTAEDLTSLVFLEAWRRRDTELLPDKVLPWLYGIATNVVRNRRRASRRHAAALARFAPPDAPTDFTEEILDRLDDERQMAKVLRLVSRLPRAQQDVLALCVWTGLSYEDASLALGVPVGTVRSRLARARARLMELAAASGHKPDMESEAEECLQ